MKVIYEDQEREVYEECGNFVILHSLNPELKAFGIGKKYVYKHEVRPVEHKVELHTKLQEKESLMNDTIIAYQDPKFVVVEFTEGGQHYTYKVPKSWDVKLDDSVVTPTGLARVVGVHNDAPKGLKLKWLVDVVDKGPYFKLLEAEKLLIEAIEEANKKEVLKKVGKALKGSFE